MISWWVAILLFCGVLVGCGGGSKGNLVMTEGPVDIPQGSADLEQEESLTEELPAKRLEELYAKSGIQGWDPSLEEELKKWDQRLAFDVPIHVNKQVKAYLVYFSTERKKIITRYLSRSTRYLPMIREIFQEHGLPEDLAYLAMVESGFNPNAYSHAHACGMWQFIKGTAARYGLEVNNYLDERRDPEKSTHAAAKYLLDLYKQFGSWYLAAASYNCGEGRVQKEINQSTHKNFWELSANMCLPSETKNYVPQMIAATIIAKNPARFGFRNVPYLPPLQYEKVKVEEPTSLQAASVACNVPVEELAALNPELRRGVTPPQGSYLLRIPKGTIALFNRNITVARLELPATAASPLRTARSSYGNNSEMRRKTQKVTVASLAPAKKNTANNQRLAKSEKKSTSQTAAAKGQNKSSAKHDGKLTMASMFGGGKISSSKGAAKAKQKGKNTKKTAKKSAPGRPDKPDQFKKSKTKDKSKTLAAAHNKKLKTAKGKWAKTDSRAGG